MRARITAILLACCACCAAETAQERGKRVVDEAVQALGGAAFLHMEDRVESGRAYAFDGKELSALSIAKIYTRYLAPVPGKVEMREREVFGKDEASGAELFTEDNAWEITFHGARPLDDLRIAAYKDSTLRNVFYILRQRLGEPGLMFYSEGSDVFENEQVEVVDITDADISTVTVYFSKTSKLPVRQVYRRRNPEFKDFDTEVTIYAKYHNVNGVQWPFNIRRERNGEKIYEMFSESVEIDKNLADNLFTLPANVKLLPKAR